jgi:multidrug efflux pump subunit AcrB
MSIGLVADERLVERLTDRSLVTKTASAGRNASEATGEIFLQVRKKVGDIRDDLPAGVVGPNFNDEYGDVYSAMYMLSADGMSLAALKNRAEEIRR